VGKYHIKKIRTYVIPPNYKVIKMEQGHEYFAILASYRGGMSKELLLYKYDNVNVYSEIYFSYQS
jgi:hypothetical protein